MYITHTHCYLIFTKTINFLTLSRTLLQNPSRGNGIVSVAANVARAVSRLMSMMVQVGGFRLRYLLFIYKLYWTKVSTIYLQHKHNKTFKSALGTFRQDK